MSDKLDTTWRILKYLPPYGPLPVPFSVTGHGTHREGFVVEFSPLGQESWVANFQGGYDGGTDDCSVLSGEHYQNIWVQVGASAYLVDPQRRVALGQWLGVFLQQLVPEIRSFLITDGKKWLAICDDGSTHWASDELAYHGFANLRVEKLRLHGDALQYIEKEWRDPLFSKPFSLDLLTGDSTGGWFCHKS